MSVARPGDETRQIRLNSAWMIGEQLVQQTIALGLSVWIARSLGPEAWGSLSFALSLYALFGIITTLGLNRILVRELAIAGSEAAARRLIVTAILMRWLAGAGMALVAVAACAVIAPSQMALVAILVPGYFLSAFDAIDLFFQSRLKSRRVARARITAFACSSLLKASLLLAGAGVLWIAAAYLLDWALVALALVLVYASEGATAPVDGLDRALARRLLVESRVEILAAFSGLAFMKIDQVMLQAMHGATEVGIMAISSRLTEAWYFVPSALVASSFPAIARLQASSPATAADRLKRLYRLLAALSVFAAIALSVAAQPIIGLLFGAQYRDAAPVLAVQAWCGLFMALGIASGAWLMAHRRGVLNLRRNALGMGVNVILNLWLIPEHGALGAAWATLAAFAVAYLLYDFIDPAMRDIGRDKLRALAWR